jgi:hypothetical protein
MSWVRRNDGSLYSPVLGTIEPQIQRWRWTPPKTWPDVEPIEGVDLDAIKADVRQIAIEGMCSVPERKPPKTMDDWVDDPTEAA